MISFIDNHRQQVLTEITGRLKTAQWALFVVAFIQESGVDLLQTEVANLIARGGKLVVLFGNAFGITEANAIRRLQALGAELRYYRKSSTGTFHAKGYLFGSASETTSVIIGSSNISGSGLRGGVEWNVAMGSRDWDLAPIVAAAKELWESPDSVPVTATVLTEIERDIRPMESSAVLDWTTAEASPASNNVITETVAVDFRFRVNKSFLTYPSRPITIPVHLNDSVRAQGLDADAVRIQGPDGHEFNGRIYGSRNNQGEYHQIVVSGHQGDALSNLPIGHSVNVAILRRGDSVHVRICHGSL